MANLLEIISGDDHSRREIGIRVWHYTNVNDNEKYKSCSLFCIEEIIGLMQKFKIQEQVSINPNMHNPVSFSINEYPLHHQLTTKTTLWEDNAGFLQELVRLNKEFTIWFFIEDLGSNGSSGTLFKLSQDLEITEKEPWDESMSGC